MALLRKRLVLDTTGNSNSGLYAAMQRGTMVRPVRLGPRAVAWPSNEIDAVVAARVAGSTEGEIKALVQQLHAQRKQGV